MSYCQKHRHYQQTDARCQVCIAADLFQQVREYEEREASCCPEDFGFEEVIAALKARAEKAEADLEKLREEVSAEGVELREDDGPQPYWRNTRALDAEAALATERHERAAVNNWNVLKIMSARNMDIGLAPLSNVEGVTYNRKKGGSLVRIGYPGNILGKIARGGYLGGLILADAEQYGQVLRELEIAARGPMSEPKEER